jgi:uncharacterized protein YndB with AHSA1/START domain
MRVHLGVDIEAPPETVWSYLVEPEKAMQWYDMLEVFEYTTEERGPGSTFYWEEEVRGKIYWNHFRTTEWVPNRVFAYEMTESSFFKGYTERWAIEPTATGCRFSFDDSLIFPYGPWGRVMGWFGEKMAKKSSQQILENLKRLAEAEAAAESHDEEVAPDRGNSTA